MGSMAVIPPKGHAPTMKRCKGKNNMEESVREAIDSFINGTDALYTTVQVYPGTLVDPPEYMDYCILCLAPEREHRPCCLLYPLFMAI